MTLVEQGAAALVALALVGRLVIQPVYRSLKAITELLDEIRSTHDDVWSMVDGFVDHERRLQRLESRQGLTPGPMAPAVSPITRPSWGPKPQGAQ